MVDLQPLTNAGRTDARSLIVDALSREWPLSAKQVFASLKTSAHAPTYQGVHKALGQLEADGVVTKSQKGYSLNKTWLEQASNTLNSLKSKYAGAEFDFSGGVLNLSFENAFEVDKFLSSTAKKLGLSKRDKLVLQWNHFWIPLFFPRQAYLDMKDFFSSCDAYGTTPSDTPLDRWSASFWEKVRLHKRLGVKTRYSSDVIVARDVVIQVFYPQELLDEIDAVYSSTKNIKKFDADAFYETVFLRPTSIPVVVLRNAALAEQIKKDVLANFK